MDPDRNNSQQPQPTPQADGNNFVGSSHAADLIRQKLERLYSDAPDTTQEIAQAEASTGHRSKHQEFMHQLSTSGKNLAQIQAEWHHYYANLPDAEKHAVWQEFYAATSPTQQQPTAAPTPVHAVNHASPKPVQPQPLPPVPVTPTPKLTETPKAPKAPEKPAPASAEPQHDHLPDDIKQQLLQTINKRTKLRPRHHLQSLVFGLGCGGLALLIVLFSFFNEVVIAPFMQPSRVVNATPIIIGTDSVAPSDKAEVIIPKINVEIPLNFDVKDIKEANIQKGLESGVVHYPTTPLPGQQGNTAFFGHSSNNIFNPGKYKFAFVLLHELVPGDTFYLTRNGVAYAYQVTDKKIVNPDQVNILDAVPGKIATATLITCDPPGTTLKRLVVIGEQVSPTPANNAPGGLQTATESGTKSLPGEAPSLWQRLFGR